MSRVGEEMASEIFVIAEAGINHNGDLSLAKKLIEIAHRAGCNAVKFQKRNPDICVPEIMKTKLRETPWGVMTYLEYKKRIEFGELEYNEIDSYCKSLEYYGVHRLGIWKVLIFGKIQFALQ